MTPRIKALKVHIARLEEVLNDSAGKPRPRIADEILNARFEMRQLMVKAAVRKPVA